MWQGAFTPRRALGALLCALTGLAASYAPCASGKEVHVYRASFGSLGSGPGQFDRPLGVAVDDSSHDVYVADSANGRVEKFDAAGTSFICEFHGAALEPLVEPTEIAVDNSSGPLDPSRGDVYIADRGRGVIDKFDPNCAYLGKIDGSEAPAGAFRAGEGEHGLKGVAVDAAGTLWVSTKEGPIYSFDDSLTNKFLLSFETAFGGASDGLDVDAEGFLYMNVGGFFAKIGESGEIVSNPFGGDEKAFRVAVDRKTGEVYLDGRETLSAFTVSGEQVESFGQGVLTLSNGVAVDAGDGTVYASDQSLNQVAVFEGVLLPNVSVLAPSERQPRSVTLNGTVNPEGRTVTACAFEYADAEEYAKAKAYSHSVPCSPSNLGSGTSPVPVNAHLEGLTPETVYDYRLVAENEARLPSATSNQEFFTGPLLQNEFASNVTSNSALLIASIDPNGGDTHYYVEYGPTTAYGSYAPLVPPGADIGARVGAQRIEVPLEGLATSANVHYRFVAVQGGEAFAGEDRQLTTQSAGGEPLLADGRVWELVSPADKKGALIELFEQGGQVQAARDGGGIAYVTQGPHVGESPTGHVTYSQVLAARRSGAWRSTDLTLPGRLPENGESAVLISHFQFEYRLFSPDLSLALVEPQIAGTPLLSAEATERTLYLRDNSSGGFSPLVSHADVPPGTHIEEPRTESEFEMHFLAATPDLTHVVFKTPLALTPEAIDEESLTKYVSGHVQWNLYEWANGKLQLVNVLPSGRIAHGPYPSVPPVRLAGMANANGLGRGDAQRSISDDGRWVAWTWGEPYNEQELATYRGLYVRDMIGEKTLRVGGPAAIYQTMSADGSKLFFLENGDLYVFDTENGISTDLTAKHGPGESSAGVQEAVVNVSADGSYAYFVATGALAVDAGGGQDNLYVSHDTQAGWTISHIATLAPADRPDWHAALYGAPFLARVGSRISPSGRYIAFDSSRSLTGYDNTDAVSGQPDEELYLYDAQRGALSCASCNPTGARPLGVFDGQASELLADRQGVWTSRESTEEDPHFDHWLAGNVPGWDNLNNNPATYQPRSLSDSGRMFFDSPDALVAQDTNGIEDVYEFEPAGVGGCEVAGASFVPRSEGCLNLVSSGSSSSESAFLDAGENGDDAFFLTTSRLVGADYDKGYDVYDAHVCASAACGEAPEGIPPSCASSDSCKGAPTAQPELFGPPPSATFKGAGNVGPPRASKPKALTRKQKLERALRACRKQRGVHRRLCVRRAQRLYGAKRARKVRRARTAILAPAVRRTRTTQLGGRQ